MSVSWVPLVQENNFNRDSLGQLKPTCQQFRILENGKPVTAGSRSWSYVPQQNLLREYLKVSETFDFYADHHLKGGGKLTKSIALQASWTI